MSSEQKSFQDRVSQLKQRAEEAAKNAPPPRTESFWQRLGYPASFVGAFFLGVFAVFLTRYIQIQMVGMASGFDATRASLFGTCFQCGEGVIFYISSMDGLSLDKAAGISGKLFSDSFFIESVAPKPPTIETVDYLRPEISETYLEAESNFTDARYRSAAAMYRTTVELSVKHLEPEGNGSLYKRIEAMADKNALPKTLIDLMHEVRFLGNDSVHASIDPEDVERGREFTKLFLVYVFELPEKIKLAAYKRASKQD